MKHLSDIRHEHHRDHIDIATLDKNPIRQTQLWLDLAIEEGYYQPNAMVLSTVNSDDQPSSRVVLLKDLNEDGFIFYTNYLSFKGQDLGHNPKAALNFYWDVLERQIRVEGSIRKTDDKTSDNYFASRPKTSQLGATASKQSKILKNRLELEEAYQHLETAYLNKEVPRPNSWGGYVLEPHMIEFWQGRSNRLHDRIRFRRDGSSWHAYRLAP